MDHREGVEGASQHGKGVGRAGQREEGGALPYVAPVTRRELALPFHHGSSHPGLCHPQTQSGHFS